MSVIDTHLHLDDQNFESPFKAADFLAKELAVNHISRGIILQLDMQRWSAQSVANAIEKHDCLAGFINIDPYKFDALERLEQGVDTYGYIGLKLHPRLQRFSLDDTQVIELVGAAGELNIPVLIDAFPDGEWLLMGFKPELFGRLADRCPGTRIILAHFGGHHCIDMMMLAKRFRNVYLDLSFSLLYYQGSSVVGDILYSCKSMKYHKIFYGSDYPDRSVGETLLTAREIFERQNVNPTDIRRIFYQNAKEFFNWVDI